MPTKKATQPSGLFYFLLFLSNTNIARANNTTAHARQMTNGNHTFDQSPAVEKVMTSKAFANGKKCITSLNVLPIIDKSNHMPDNNAARLTNNDEMPDTALSPMQEPSNKPRAIYIKADGKDNKMPSKMLTSNCRPNKIAKRYTDTH